jgi:hypothetical protein
MFFLVFDVVIFVVLTFPRKVTTTNFTTSKFKKNVEKIAIDQYIEKIYNSDQNVKSEKDQNIESENITTSKVVDHYYENQNVEKNEKNAKVSFLSDFHILTTYGIF